MCDKDVTWLEIGKLCDQQSNTERFKKLVGEVHSLKVCGFAHILLLSFTGITVAVYS